MRRFLFLPPLSTIGLCFMPVLPQLSAAERTASVTALGHSFSMGFATRSVGGEIGFTTYTSSTGLPLHDTDGNFIYVSQEVRPVALGSGTYRADYIVCDTFCFEDYGSVSFNLPATDTNRNGFPDILESRLAGNGSFSGTAHSDVDGFNANFFGTVTRSSGQRLGNYNGTVSVPGFGSYTFDGRIALADAIGTITYDLAGARGATISVSIRNLDREVLVTGSPNLDRAGINRVNLTGFTLQTTDGDTVIANASVLNRSGDAYRGRINLVDGEPGTSWPDYQDFLLEIVDDNDWDSDGIPDLTDPNRPPTAFQVTPRPVDAAAPNGTVVATLSVTDPDAGDSFTYEFLSNPMALFTISGDRIVTAQSLGSAAGSTLLIAIVAIDAGGHTIEQTVQITIETAVEPPSIRAQPSGLAVEAGRELDLSVEAQGDDLNYEWTKDGTLVEGGSGAILVLSSVSSRHGGTYRVRIWNSVGEVFSTPVTIEVLPPRLFPSVARVGANQVRVSWLSKVGQSYTVERSNNLSSWIPFGFSTGGDGSVKEVFDFLERESRFYRIRVDY